MLDDPKSGYYFNNKFARVALETYEEVMGRNGLNAILHQAHLSNLIENYPPATPEREFDFGDFTALHVALEEIYGERGSHIIALRAGRATFKNVLKTFGALAGIGDPEFQELPLQTKVRIGLPALSKILMQFSDQLTEVAESEVAFFWTIQRCPICWNRRGTGKPVCHFWPGILQAMLNYVSGGLEFQINESQCCAAGDEACKFVISKEPI
jgi:bacteriochlorophyll 4-vinyl reductase